MSIENKYEFMIIFDCELGNPNGDPDTDNRPRMDAQDGHGIVSDVSIKRKIRHMMSLLGHEIFVEEGTNLNRKILQAGVETGSESQKPTKDVVAQRQQYLYSKYVDIRTFGAVLTTGINAGKLTGPVNILNSRSIDPISLLELSLTRVATTKDLKASATLADYEKWEAEQPITDLQTMGRKTAIPYGLYVTKGFISSFQAQVTGFSEDDLKLLLQCIMFMFEHSRSGVRGMMSLKRLFVFKHVGWSGDEKARKQQSKLGVAGADKLLTLGSIVTIERINMNKPPRAYSDYQVSLDKSSLPRGIEMLDLTEWDEELFTKGWVGKIEPQLMASPSLGSQKRKKSS